MARLTWTGWLGVVGLCLMLTLAVMPKTKWLLKLHGDVATGELKVGQSSYGYIFDSREATIDVYELLRLLQPNMPAGLKKDLAGAIITKAEENGDNRRAKMAEMAAKYPDNAFVQAAACRYFSMATTPRPDKDGKFITPKQPAEEIAKRQRRYSQLVEIANRGIAADPDNLYFDLILACAKCGQHKVDEAREIIHRATKKQTYNEYGWDECNLLTDMMKGTNDSGAYLRLQVYATLVLPYYTNMKSMSIWLSQTGTAEQKRHSSLDLLVVANTVSKKVEILVGILVMRAIIGIALVGETRHETGKKPTKEAYLAAINKLQLIADARFPRGSIPELRSIYDQSSRLTQAVKEYSDENDRKVMSSDPGAYPSSPFAKMKLSLGFMVAVLFLLPAALMQIGGQKLRKHAGAARALPLLVPMFIALLTQEFNEVLTVPNYTSLMALSIAGLIVAFALAWFERLARISFWIAMGVSAAGLLYGVFVAIVGYTPFSWTLLIAIATAASVFASRDNGPQWVRNVLSGLLILGAACSASVSLALSPISNLEWIISFVFLILAACIGPVRPNAGKRIVGPAILAASMVFALLCRQMVAIDQHADLMTKTLLYETDQVRQMASKIP